VNQLSPQDQAKIAAGRKAAATYPVDGMRLGLGSGTTSHFFVRALAERVEQGLDIVGVPTSNDTRDLARELGIPLADLDDVPELDVVVDSADEVGPDGTMIKGGGACLLWEKIVARSGARMVAVVDDTKLVATLGRFPLPIEVVRFGHVSTTRLVHDLLGDFGHPGVELTPRLRDGERLVTDSGNYLLDAHLQQIDRAPELTVELNRIPGVVENGLFVGIASEVVVGHPDGSAEILPLPLPGQQAQA